MNNFIDEQLKEVIGFQYVMNQLSIRSPYGRKYIKNLKLVDDLDTEYHYVSQFLLNLSLLEPVEQLLYKFKDLLKTIKDCQKGKTLDIVDLFEIKVQALLMNQLRDVYNPIGIGLYIEDCHSIIELLSPGKPFIYDFYIYDEYSEDLKHIREEKRKIEKAYFIADETEREQLKVLRTEYVLLETNLELEIREYLSIQLKQMVDVMEENVQKISHIDLLIGKAKLAKKYHAVKPNLVSSNLTLIEMFNPYIKHHVELLGNEYTKNSIELKQGTTVLTGANMGGKSSVIKTVALNVLLAHLGFYVFAKEASIPKVSGILCIGLESSINMHGLSSFGYEIVKMNQLIQKIKQDTYLLCIDEFARTTNPVEGQKFARAFAAFANNFSSYTLLATHYDDVVRRDMNHYQIVGLKEEEIFNGQLTSLKDINRLMNYSLTKATKKQIVPKEAYKVSLLLNIDNDFKEYLDKSYEE